jgi:hypothetical protein
MTWTLNRGISNGGPFAPEPLMAWVVARSVSGPYRYRYTGERQCSGWIVVDKLGFNVARGPQGQTITDESTARDLAAQWNA